MAQPPFRSDAFEVENADAPVGPRLIEANETNGSLRFTDPLIPGGIDLNELAGLQQAQQTIIVSQTGTGGSKDAEGNPITTLQGALDAVPDSADANERYTIVLMPGIYVEDVVVTKDYTTITSLGGVVVRNAGAVSTFRILQGAMTVPRRITLKNLRIENTEATEACVDLLSSQFATGTITVASLPNVGDNVTINGVVLTAIANGGVPAPGEFEIGTDAPTTADNLAAAISDPVNVLTTTVIPLVSGSVVTLRAFSPGVAGDAITLATSVALVLVISGGTLTGGADVSTNSTVGFDLIDILDCDLVASGVTGFQVRAQAVNNIYIRGGNWAGSSTGSTVSIVDCAECRLFDISACPLVAMSYDNTNAEIPFITTSVYEISNCLSATPAGTLSTNFVGVGSMTVTDSTFPGVVTYGGDAPARSFTATRCSFGPVTVGGTGAAVLSNCSRGTLTGGGTGTLAETTSYGSAAFVAVPSVSVVFAEPQPDTSYTVTLEYDGPPAAITDIPVVPVAAKLTTGFDITFGAAQTTTVSYVVHRDI
jgi:hypothetical protein